MYISKYYNAKENCKLMLKFYFNIIILHNKENTNNVFIICMINGI